MKKKIKSDNLFPKLPFKSLTVNMETKYKTVAKLKWYIFVAYNMHAANVCLATFQVHMSIKRQVIVSSTREMI